MKGAIPPGESTLNYDISPSDPGRFHLFSAKPFFQGYPTPLLPFPSCFHKGLALSVCSSAIESPEDSRFSLRSFPTPREVFSLPLFVVNWWRYEGVPSFSPAGPHLLDFFASPNPCFPGSFFAFFLLPSAVHPKCFPGNAHGLSPPEFFCSVFFMFCPPSPRASSGVPELKRDSRWDPSLS